MSSSVERRVRDLAVDCCWRAEEEHKHKQAEVGGQRVSTTEALWICGGQTVMGSRCAAGIPSGGEVPTSSRRGKRGRSGVVWQPSGPAEKCVVMRNLVYALLEEFVSGASRAARVTRAAMDRRPTHPGASTDMCG
jgi:hypothetical protein